jgi:hypothetical protein
VLDSALSGVVCAVLLLLIPRPKVGERCESEVILLRLLIVEKIGAHCFVRSEK